MAGLVVVLTRLVLLFDSRDQVGYGIGLNGLRSRGGFRMRFRGRFDGLWLSLSLSRMLRRFAGWREGGRLRLGRWNKDLFLSRVARNRRCCQRGSKNDRQSPMC